MLGAMAELGDDSVKEHGELIELIKKYQWEKVVLVGGDFLGIQHPFLSFANSTQARDWWRSHHFHEAYVLVKGSRSMKMEEVIT